MNHFWKVTNINTLTFVFLILINSIVQCSDDDNKYVQQRIPISESIIDTDTQTQTSLSEKDAAETTTEPIEEHDDDNAYSYSNRSLTGGNELWDSLLKECDEERSLSCIQKNVYSYLDRNLEHPNDYEVTDSLIFKRNLVDYTKYTREENDKYNYDEDDEEERAASPFQEVADALYGKGVKFMMTHDLEMQMPETVFEGATFKISPRSFEGNGALVKMELLPRDAKGVTEPRILFKKIRKFFQNKLFMAFLALMLVVKLIKVKLMFVLPVMVGVGTAKKILLKVLLFVFPALSHLFKLCSYYHNNYHETKFHHHHHQVSHVHHEPPPHVSPHHGISLHQNPEIHYDYPPPSYLPHHSDDFELSGPGLGPEYISHRNAYDFKPSSSDENEINSWGLGGYQSAKKKVSPHIGANRKVYQNTFKQKPPPLPIRRPQPNRPIPGQLAPNQIEELAKKAEKEVMLKVKLQQEQQRLHQENLRLQEQIKLQEQLKLQQKLQEHFKYQEKLTEQQKYRNQQFKVDQQYQQQSIAKPYSTIQVSANNNPGLAQRPAAVNTNNKAGKGTTSVQIVKSVSSIFDPFYTPILQKIDAVFIKLGVLNEECRERLVCSMYKNPSRFSPYSNLISVELSRDSKELQTPTSTNADVIRFYKYIEAARDGQDKKDCIRLYPLCSINTDA